jgi:hypothetical protein
VDEVEGADEVMISTSSFYDKDATREQYVKLMALNPHLPPMELISASDDIELSFGIGRMPTLRLSVYITLPKKDESP